MGLNATIAISALDGTTPSAGDNSLVFNGLGDIETYGADATPGDAIVFSGNGTSATVNEGTAGAVDKAAVITGTVTVLLDPGMSIKTSDPGVGGLFHDASAKIGSSLMTLGGEDGFQNFTAGETLSFDVDGQSVSLNIPSPGDVVNYNDEFGTPQTFTVGAGGITELELAKYLAGEINNTLPGSDYQVLRTGKSVSILKNKDLTHPITITDFSETGTSDARLRQAPAQEGVSLIQKMISWMPEAVLEMRRPPPFTRTGVSSNGKNMISRAFQLASTGWWRSKIQVRWSLTRP